MLMMNTPRSQGLACWGGLVAALCGGAGCFLIAKDRFVLDVMPSLLGHRLVPFMTCFLLASSGAVLGAVRLARLPAMRTHFDRGTYVTHVGAAVLALVTGSLFTWFGILLAFATAVEVNAHGRRLRRFRRVQTPRVRKGSVAGRARGDRVVRGARRSARAARCRVARHGLQGARGDRVFAQLSLDLLAVGAPPYLLEITHADANDEVRHAALCFDIARGFDGEDHAPAPFPAARLLRPLALRSRRLALTQIAIDSLGDGVLNEGMSARVLARLSERASDARLAHHLRAMAPSTRRVTRRTAGGSSSGVSPRAARSSAARSSRRPRICPRAWSRDLDGAAASGEWEKWGLQGHALERACFAKARANAVRKLTELAASPGFAWEHNGVG